MNDINIITPPAIYGDAVAGDAARTRSALESLIENVNKSNFDIADLCYKIKSRGHYAPYATFQEYSKTLNLKARKIQYLTRMAEVMDQVGITRAQYEPLGIAKLREVTSLEPGQVWINPDTKAETPIKEFIIGFVNQGADISLEDIKLHVRTLKGFVGENDLVWRNICFTRLVAEQVFDPAVEMTRNRLGSVGKDDEGMSKDASEAACVEVWAVEYMNDPANNVLPEETEE